MGLAATIFVALTMLFYKWSVGAAWHWGVQVRAAFDLYRFDLLKSLGYEQRPSSAAEERALWHRISVRLLYPDTEDPRPYKDPTRIVASPPDVLLTSTRLLLPRPDGGFDVTLTVSNKDRRGREAEDVTVTETVPDGYRFLVGSLSGSNPATALRNVKPLELRPGNIAAGATVLIGYSIKPGSDA